MNQPNSPWIQTYTGLKYYFEAPTPEMISITDIAHALSLQCRFTGHSNEFYCPTPDQRILTADLEWVEAGSLSVGDELVGFDEHPIEPGSAGKKRRRYRPSVVTHAEPVKRAIVRLELSDGSTIRASAEHPWLVATKASGNQAWRTSAQLAEDFAVGRKRYMHKFVEPWKANHSRDAGWLAGMYDGEGYFSAKNRGGVLLGLSQKPGIVLAEAERLLSHYGYSCRSSTTGDGSVQTLQMHGGLWEAARLLGSIRPYRLLDKFKSLLAGGDLAKQMTGIDEPLEITGAWHEGEEWVAGLETSTHTYLCEGYAAHNSVAQHSVLVSYHTFDPFYGLMHDATEAYVGDMNRPLKSRMPSSSFYRFADNAAWVAIAQRWPRLWPPTKGIGDVAILNKEKLRRFLLKADCKRVDLAMLVTESRDVLADGPHADWEINQNTNPPYPEKIEPWTPHEAERKFLERYEATISGTTCAFGVCARCDQPHSEFDTFCRGCHSLGIAKKQQRVLNLEAEVERLKAELANNQA